MTKIEKAISLNSSEAKLKSVESISELHRLLLQMDLSPTLNQARLVIENIETSLLETLQQLEANNTITAETLGKLYSEAMAKELGEVSLALTNMTQKAQSVGGILQQVLNNTLEVLPNLCQEVVKVQTSTRSLQNLIYLLAVMGVVNLSGIMYLALSR